MAKDKKDQFEGAGVDPQDIKDELDPSPLVRKLRRDNNVLSKRVEELKLELGENEDFFSKMAEELLLIEPLKAVAYKAPKSGGIDAPTSVMLVLSDWHIGEYIKAGEVEDFNNFNWAISQKRVHYLVGKFLDWVSVLKKVNVIDELVILCNGDFVSGDIHYELQVTNEFPVPVQAVRAGFLLSKAVSELAPHFKKVRVEFITADNHSRLTVRNQFKEGGYNTYSYVVGYMAKERLSKHKNIEFNVHPQIQKLVRVQGYNYLCMHGHTIKGWSGFPWYGADRQVAREAKARMNIDDRRFDRLVIGHFHTPLRTPDYTVNGSLSGTTEFDHGCGRHSHPCQLAWQVHPKYGEMNWNEFWVHHGDDVDFGGNELAGFPEDEEFTMVEGFEA